MTVHPGSNPEDFYVGDPDAEAWQPIIPDKEEDEVIASGYLFDDDFEPPVCHCGWVHYEGACQCDKPECIAARQREEEAWANLRKDIGEGRL